jgi:hypothetical protein
MSHQRDLMSGKMIPPSPPPELKGRAVAAARAAMNRAEEPDVWMRIWGSRLARLAWAASVAGLLFGHVVVEDHFSSRLSNPVVPIQVGQEVQDDLAALIRLERITVSLPDRIIGAGLGEPRVGLSKESEDFS